MNPVEKLVRAIEPGPRASCSSVRWRRDRRMVALDLQGRRCWPMNWLAKLSGVGALQSYDLPLVAQAYSAHVEDDEEETKLRCTVRDLLTTDANDYRPTLTRRHLPRLPCCVVVSTALDHLLEDAYRREYVHVDIKSPRRSLRPRLGTSIPGLAIVRCS